MGVAVLVDIRQEPATHPLQGEGAVLPANGASSPGNGDAIDLETTPQQRYS